MTIKDAIQILDLTPPFSKRSLKSAYRDALMVWHPDRFQGNTALKAKAESKTYQINEAYVLLNDIPETSYPFQMSASTQDPRRTQPPKPVTPPPAPTSEPSKPAPAATSVRNPFSTAKKKPDFLTTTAWAVTLVAGIFLIALIPQVRFPTKSPNQGSIDTTNAQVTPNSNAPALKGATALAPNLPIAAIRIQADKGDKQAQFLLGLKYVTADEVEYNAPEGVKWFLRAAEQKHANAQFNLGMSYANGLGVVQDMEQANKWFRLSAEQGNADAQFNLGFSHATGDGTKKNQAEAVKWYRMAAEQDHLDAQYFLGRSYLRGEGIAEDLVEAIVWYRKAAEEGLPDAQFDLGMCYTLGTGVPKDQVEAVKWYRKAAEQGLAKAQNNLGYSLAEGEGAPKDFIEAAKWFILSAAQQDGDASVKWLANLKDKMTPEQITEAHRRADEFKRQQIEGEMPVETSPDFDKDRAQADNGDKEAQWRVALAYLSGVGVLKDETESVKWCQKAAEQGLVEAQRHLGNLFFLGKVVPKNWEASATWFRKAADQGDAEAQLSLGNAYMSGYGLEKDEVEGLRCIRMAAEQNLGDAQVKLGECYYTGEGVQLDIIEALRWLRRAGEQGNAIAQFLLGSLYSTESGVPNDYVEAHMWFSLSAENTKEDDDTRGNIASLEKRMSQKQLSDALKRFYEFKSNRPQNDGTKGDVAVRGKNTVVVPSVNAEEQLKHLPTDHRLNSGSLLTDHLQELGGKGKLTLDNGLADDAFVKMISQEKLVASFYVRGGEKFTFDHVPDGVYKLVYCTGFGWNANRRDFVRGRHAVRYDEALNYATTRTTEGPTIIISTGVITLTLHKVADGNTKTSDIPLAEFDSY